MKLPRPETVVDCSITEPKDRELTTADHPMLPPSQGRNT